MDKPDCRDCRYYRGAWRQTCSAPYVVEKFFTPPLAMTMREYPDYCGPDGKLWEERLGPVAAVLTWGAKKMGWLQ